jgi:hypothetical protein
MALVEIGCIHMYVYIHYMGGVDWIVLAQDRENWRALVNAVMNLGVL